MLLIINNRFSVCNNNFCSKFVAFCCKNARKLEKIMEIFWKKFVQNSEIGEKGREKVWLEDALARIWHSKCCGIIWHVVCGNYSHTFETIIL